MHLGILLVAIVIIEARGDGGQDQKEGPLGGIMLMKLRMNLDFLSVCSF